MSTEKNRTNFSSEQKNEIICDCSGTTKTKVLELINKGADFDKIASATGACTGCGSCDALILDLIRGQVKDRDH